MNVVVLPDEVKDSIVFCEDCKKELISLEEYLTKIELFQLILKKINVFFSKHFEHELCILTNGYE